MAAGSLVSVAVLAAALEVQGTTTCPTAAQVSERLAALLPAPPAGVEQPRARVWQQGDEVVAELDAPDGRNLGSRRFAGAHPCDELAAAIAVSLAAWASDVHPAFAPELQAERPPPAAPSPVSRAWPAAEPAPRLQWAIGAGAGAAISSGATGWAGAAVGAAWVLPPGWRWSLRLELDAQTERRLALSTGAAAWRRFSLGVGVERALWGDAGGGGWLRGFALARVAWLDLRGDGFVANRGDGVVDPGASAGLRATTTGGRWRPWVELAASLWVVRHDVEAAGLGTLGHLPGVELFMRGGVAFASSR